MPRPRAPHLHREISRHGVATWYVRRSHGPRKRIRAEFGTPEFEAEYRAALDSTPVEHRKKAGNATARRQNGRICLLPPGASARTS